MTTSRSRGRSTSMFRRLWTRAPRTAIQSWAMGSAASAGNPRPGPPCRASRGFPKRELYHADALAAASAGCVETAVLAAVGSVRHHADEQPDGESFPRLAREAGHDEHAGQ